MARTPRAEFDGAIHHVTQRGNRGQAIFHTDDDRRFFLAELGTTEERYEWRCLSYCLMTNHYHVVIETAGPTLGDGMRRFGSVYAQEFNRRHATYGHLFQERYGAVLVRSDAQFARLLGYVAFNPVAARLCADPVTWQWSSHRVMLAGGYGAAGARVEELLDASGGYAKLFAADNGSSSSSADLHRPSLEALLSLSPLDQAIRTALDYGYRQVDVAGGLGISQPQVSRLLRGAT
jgi:REP element-mobilizing transposase RayT